MHKKQKHKGKRIYDINNNCEKHHAGQHVKLTPTSQSTQRTTPLSTVIHHPLGHVTVCFGTTSSCSSCRAELPIPGFAALAGPAGRAYIVFCTALVVTVVGTRRKMGLLVCCYNSYLPVSRPFENIASISADTMARLLTDQPCAYLLR